MKKYTLFLNYLMIPLLIVLFTACSDSEESNTNDVEIFWEKSVIRGCLNKDPFAFGPGSEYNVDIGSKLGQLYYSKNKAIGFDASSYVIKNEKSSFNLDYDYGNLLKDSKTNSVYLIDKNYSSSAIYKVDQSNFARGPKLAESPLLKLGSIVEIYNDHLYLIEKDDNGDQLIKYNVNMSDKKVLYSFEPKIDEWVRIISIYEYDNNVYGTFQVLKSEAPYDRSPILIQLNLETGDILWKISTPKNHNKIHFLNEEMFVFINGEKTIVFNLLTGEEIRTLSIFPNEGYVEEVYGNTVVVREREYNDNYPIKEWLKGYDLDTEAEVLSMEGLFLGTNNDKLYSIDSESILRIKSISDSSISEVIDLNNVGGEDKFYNYWKMANGSNLLLGQDDQCNASNLILIQLP